MRRRPRIIADIQARIRMTVEMACLYGASSRARASHVLKQALTCSHGYADSDYTDDSSDLDEEEEEEEEEQEELESEGEGEEGEKSHFRPLGSERGEDGRVSLTGHHRGTQVRDVCVRILLHMCPHTAAYVSEYCCMCPNTAACVRILLHICSHTATYVSAYCCMCVLILRHVCRHTATYAVR
jgi:hypothetical protein